MPPTNLRVLATLSVISSFAATAARAELRIDQTVDKSAAWTIGYNNSLKGCIASAISDDKTTVWIGFSGEEPDAPAYLAFTNPDWGFIEPRKFYPVEIRSTDSHRRKGYGSGVERGNERGLFVFGVQRQLLEELGEGYGLALSVDKRSPTVINISGSSDAIEKLFSCQHRRDIAARAGGMQSPRSLEEIQTSERDDQRAAGESLPGAVDPHCSEVHVRGRGAELP
jgi:hypothetical protein